MQPFYTHNDGQITLYRGDCLNVMPWLIEQGVKVDAVICDPPYGTTECSWDAVIPFDDMWRNIARLLKPRGAVVLFGSEPFSTTLRMSNLDWYKYDWIWDKHAPTGYLNAKHQPMRQHELISVFCDGVTTYNPEMRKGEYRAKGGMRKTSSVWGKHHSTQHFSEDYYPTSILEISNADRLNKIHPTQKPLELMQYLIRTYTNPGDLVLDFTSGSGTTLHAALIEGRRAIGIERDLDDKGNYLGYCEYTRQRLLGEKPVTLHVDGQQVAAVQSAMSIF
jgi:site-specific DNA-methyltransferase (adenine-specific)